MICVKRVRCVCVCARECVDIDIGWIHSIKCENVCGNDMPFVFICIAVYSSNFSNHTFPRARSLDRSFVLYMDSIFIAKNQH